VGWRVAREAAAGWPEWTAFTTYYKGWLARVRPELGTDTLAQYQPGSSSSRSGGGKRQKPDR
jgi:hypothetical protein